MCLAVKHAARRLWCWAERGRWEPGLGGPCEDLALWPSEAGGRALCGFSKGLCRDLRQDQRLPGTLVTHVWEGREGTTSPDPSGR